MSDHHRTLGVPAGATLAEIRRAFRRIAFDCHPDRNSSRAAAARFRKAREAYEGLRRLHAAPAPDHPAEPREPATAPLEEAAARAFSTFVEELAGQLSRDGGTVDLELAGASVRVRIRRT